MDKMHNIEDNSRTMDLNLSGKRVVVAGASSGIGFAVAKAFIQEGARVAICSSNGEKLKKAAAQMKAATFFPLDLNLPGAGAQLVCLAEQFLGGIDVLVTNTGGPKAAAFQALNAADWESAFRSLWLSPIESIREALVSMRKQKYGRILLLTSISAKEPISELTLSNSYRAGLLGLMKSISREVAIDGVTVNAILPGYTKTERLSELGVSEDHLIAQIPAKRLGRPEEIASLSVFLGSPLASYITGQAIACDGGYLRSY
jgi:3-oxoacyl-[acyl-carrier protein] reductase